MQIDGVSGLSRYTRLQQASFSRAPFSALAPLMADSVSFSRQNRLQFGYKKPEATHPLEHALFATVDKNTPAHVKATQLLDLSQPGEIMFRLKREHLAPYDAQKNPEGLDLDKWLANYEKEAKVSTAGIRGPQNILYPWDTRFPISQVGVLLATTAKAMAAKEKYPGQDIHKLGGNEVRYHSKDYLDLISRAQAAQGITTHVPHDRASIPIGLASFLAFKLDLLGGEYLTSSHGISVKLATKDLNDQGSQYLPEESMAFVSKIKQMFEQARKDGVLEVKLAAKNNPLIDESLMKQLDDGTRLYTAYLKDGVATPHNLQSIQSLKNPVIIENVGGAGHRTTSKILDQLGVGQQFEWLRTQEDPFFHGVGKSDVDPKGKPGFYDWSADTTITKIEKDGDSTKTRFPVIETIGYDKELAKKPVGSVVLITDPDHDRLITAQIESADRKAKLTALGLDTVDLGNGRLLTVYTPNQSFLMVMDAWKEQLKAAGQWDKHPRFVIKTTASAMAWDEWAKANNVQVVNTPVGFKELANVMKKAEKQITDNPDKPVIVEDVYGQKVNLGVQPRMVAAAEESGGIVIGPEEMITSMAGRKAISLREKGAVEPILITASLASQLEKKGQMMSDYLGEIFEKNDIKGRYDIRVDVNYYNESEADIKKLMADKVAGEAKRTKNDMYYLSMAMAVRDGKLSLQQSKDILNEAFGKDGLKFDDLEAIQFVGDGTYLKFPNKYIEIRPSGTDAKTKAYGAGNNKAECLKFATVMGNYSGDRTPLHDKLIDKAYYEGVKDHAANVYTEWANKDANNTPFRIPDYKQTWAKLLK